MILNRFTLFVFPFLLFILFFNSCNKSENHISNNEVLLQKVAEEFLNPKSNKDSLKKILVDFRKAKTELNSSEEYLYHFNLCDYYANHQIDNRKALLYADSAIISLGHDTKRYADLARTLFVKADILIELGSYNEAFDTFFQSKKYIDKVSDNCLSSKYSYSIAMVLYRQKKFVDATYFFKKGLNEILSCDDDGYVNSYFIQEYYNNIALSFTKYNELDSAIVWYNKGLKFIKKFDNADTTSKSFKSAKGVIYGNLGGVLIEKGQEKEGEELLLKSIEINDKPKYDRKDALTAKFKLINFYFKQNDLIKVKKYLNEIDTSSVLKKIDHQLTFLQLKTKYYKSKKDYNTAFIYLTKANKIQDSVQKEIDGFNKIDLTERFNYLNVEQRVDDLVQQRDFQNLLIVVISIFVGISVAFLVIIYIFWNKSRKNLRLMKKLNHQISEQNKKLEITLKDLERSDREKDGILRTVAHDLRNPIAGIATVINLMADEVKSDDDKFKFDLLKVASGNALSLINDLMEATESGKSLTDEDKISVDFVQFVRSVIDFQSFKAKEKQQEIIFKTTVEELPITIFKDKIARVLTNLIDNAIKFSPNGKQINVVLHTENNTLFLNIIDEGIGITEEMKHDVFMVFTRSKRFGTNGEKSHGLGLSICKHIVQSHRGEIEIFDNPNGGTIFSMQLPLN